MLNSNNLLCIIICIVIFSSCTPERANRIIYATPAANVPYLTQKGEAKVTAYYSGNSTGGGTIQNDLTTNIAQSNGYDILGAYALTDNWSIMAGYSHKTLAQVYNYDSTRYYGSGFDAFDFGGTRTETNIFDSSLIRYNSSFYKIGGGYSVTLNEERYVTFSIYAGVDFGKFTMHDTGLDSTNTSYTRDYSVKNIKPWLQGAFNFGNAKTWVSCSLGSRLSFLHFGGVNTSYKDVELSYFYLDKIHDQTIFFWEPYVNFVASVPGLKWLKVDGQFSTCNDLQKALPKVASVNGSIGLTVDITNVLHKK